MTPAAYLEWLDKEIDLLKYISKTRTEYGDGRLEALMEAKKKFISLTPPPTTLS
jgi:hypothetical protein